MSDVKVSKITPMVLVTMGLLGVCGAFVVAGIISDRHKRNGVAVALTNGDASKALPLLRKYGCSGCHGIPGAPGADGQVGGALSGLSGRVYIGGVLTNSPDHLIEWIVAPQRFSPNSAMPITGITEAEARDVAAYLYQH